MEALRKKERQDETQFTTKILWKKLIQVVQLFHFVQFSFPVTHLMPYYAETGPSCPPNRVNVTNNSNNVLLDWIVTCYCGGTWETKSMVMESLNPQPSTLNLHSTFNLSPKPCTWGSCFFTVSYVLHSKSKRMQARVLLYAHVSSKLHANTSWLWEIFGKNTLQPKQKVCTLHIVPQLLKFWEKFNLKLPNLIFLNK